MLEGHVFREYVSPGTETKWNGKVHVRAHWTNPLFTTQYSYLLFLILDKSLTQGSPADGTSPLHSASQ